MPEPLDNAKPQFAEFWIQRVPVSSGKVNVLLPVSAVGAISVAVLLLDVVPSCRTI